MASRPPIEMSADQRQIASVAKALKVEADGKAMRRALLKEMKGAAGPLVTDLKQAALHIPSSGAHDGQELRPQIAAKIKPVVRLSGERTGLAIRVSKTSNVRGFNLAARRLNRKSFRHKVFGRDVWVDQQTGSENWFDNTVKGRREEIKRAVLHSVEKTVTDLANRTKGS